MDALFKYWDGLRFLPSVKQEALCDSFSFTLSLQQTAHSQSLPDSQRENSVAFTCTRDDLTFYHFCCPEVMNSLDNMGNN